MEKIDINLQYLDKGYGIKYFSQTVSFKDGSLEFIVNNLGNDKKAEADTIVRRAWNWAYENMEHIKDYLSVQLAKEFEDMRQQKKKNVPADDEIMIREQLRGINVSRVTFYPAQGAFTMDFMGYFNDYQYRMYVSVKDDFTFEQGSILTMGGFKPPKNEPEIDLTKAANLYDYHIRHGNKKELYKHYAILSPEEIYKFIDLFIADETETDERIDLLLYLALYAHSCGDKLPDKLYRYLIDNEIFYYGEIYLRADNKFADELIALLEELDDPESHRLAINHILCALAMIPCKQTNDFLIKSSRTPLPAWAEKLYILPKDYAKVGGWETTKDGIPRILFGEEVKAFERCDKEKSSALLPVTILSEVCGFCGQPLTLVFDDKQKLATCLYCSCYQTVFTKVAASGIHWHPANTPDSFFRKHPEYMKNDENIAERFEYGLRLSEEKRLAMWTAHQFAEITLTQIGGMPTAVNDVSYPACPDCGKTMCFTAQFDMADIEDSEGLYYFFTCEDCGTVGVNYDQS
ncbi:hypothetical protein D0T84_12400 [Dysgonomonas sp. 521]|uniref:hypothetical protein n=1 Tax=Dysgonomonas sp. 521 TaxID=2302932 RepID=UPI0013D4B108|nr:hypothetical protein [Dysgonomonas sp. 521]NDV95707.1 hypothetical protein [Dysgonomonas sp. 521]